MSIFALILLAFSMSMDAFAAAISKGAAAKHVSTQEIIRAALIFGVVEGITPLVGWGAGQAAQSFIAEYDHWVAFILLLILGIRMIRESFSAKDENETDNKNNKLGILILTAIATSIDSMIVGVGLAFLDVHIGWTALAIGSATTFMAAIGMGLGKMLGKKVGQRAELVGGLVLIAIGSSILLKHLGFIS